MNELAIIFVQLGNPTKEVLQAAGTEWNFLSFTPGLVGGHCIGVDGDPSASGRLSTGRDTRTIDLIAQ
jgi:UDP-N-acetyl-D-mannosaminuronate dehydrogenase